MLDEVVTNLTKAAAIKRPVIVVKGNFKDSHMLKWLFMPAAVVIIAVFALTLHYFEAS
jgi:hypothetical protein